MMKSSHEKLWVLLDAPNNENGSAIPLISTEFTIQTGLNDGYGFNFRLLPLKEDEIHISALKGGEYGYNTIWREGYIREVLEVEFQLDYAYASGRSADLLFALAVVIHSMPSTGKPYPTIAATGKLIDKGRVKAVQGIPKKFKAAFKVLPENSILFYPSDNQGDIDTELQQQAIAQKIELCPVDRLDEAVEKLGIAINKVYLNTPYRGLEEFHSQHRSIYFGRTAEIKAICEKLLNREKTNTPSVLVVAASGAGKSSLVQAGVIPALQQGQIALALLDRPAFSTIWRPSNIKGELNEQSLVNSLTENWHKQSELIQLDTQITRFSELYERVEQILPSERRFIWVINQMEELFTMGFSAELLNNFGLFLQKLQKLGVWLIASLRNDFYTQYQACSSLHKLFGTDAQYDLQALNVLALRQVIEEPAKLAGMTFAVDKNGISLADHLLADMGSNTDALPLLEFVLKELYQAGKSQGEMTYESYQSLGGLMGGIGQTADSVFNQLDSSVQETLPRLLWKLTVQITENGQSQIASQTIILNDFPKDDAIHPLIDAFTEQRLLILDSKDKQNITVRVAHEALLTHWGKAKMVIAEFNSDQQLHNQIQQQAVEWSVERKKDLLIPLGLRLEKARELLKSRKGLLEEEVKAFIKFSVANQNRVKRQKKGVLIISFITLIGVAVGLWVLKQDANNKAQNMMRLKQEADDKTREILVGNIAMQALSAIKDPGETNGLLIHALLLAAQAFKLNPDSLTAQGMLQRILINLPPNFNKYLKFHDKKISFNILDISQDRKQVVSVERDSNNLILWDIYSGKPIGKPWKGHQDTVNTAAFSSDGKYVISGGDDKKLILWDVISGQPHEQSWSEYNDSEYQYKIDKVTFSSSGRYVIMKGDYNEFNIWDLTTGQSLDKPKEHIWSAAISQDEKYVVYAESKNNTLILWEIATDSAKDKPWLPQNDQKYPISLTFNPTGKHVVSGGYDGKLTLWDVATGMQIGEPWNAQRQLIYSVKYSPDGKKLVTAGRNGVILWDVTSKKIIGKPWSGGMYYRTVNANFSLDGQYVVSKGGYNSLILWNVFPKLSFGKTLEGGEKNSITAVAFHPNGKYVISGEKNGNLVTIDIASGQILHNWTAHKERVNTVVFSTDGQYIASGGEDGLLKLWSSATHQIIWKQQHKYTVYKVAFSPDGKNLLSGGNQGELWLHSMMTKQYMQELTADSLNDFKKNYSIKPESVILNGILGYGAFADKNGKLIMANLFEDKILWTRQLDFEIESINFSSRLRDITVNGKKNEVTFNMYSGYVLPKIFEQGPSSSNGIHTIYNAFAFSPDAKYVISKGKIDPLRRQQNNSLRLWNVATGLFEGNPWKGGIASPTSIDFSHDGKYIISDGGGALLLWDVTRKQPTGGEWLGHSAEIQDISFSPDSKHIISSSKDGGLILWNVAKRKILGEQWYYKKPVKYDENSIAYSPDGKKIINGRSDGSLILWNIDPESWYQTICEKANRNFTREEWDRFIGEDILPYQKTCDQFPLEE